MFCHSVHAAHRIDERRPLPREAAIVAAGEVVNDRLGPLISMPRDLIYPSHSVAAAERCSADISGGIQGNAAVGEPYVRAIMEAVQHRLAPGASRVRQFEDYPAAVARTA